MSLNTKNQYRIIWILLCLIALITIYPFIEIGITNGDDMMYYHLSFHKDLWPLAFEFAKGNGRFYFAIVNPLYTFPYIFDNFIVTKTIQYSSLLLSFYVFSIVVKKIFKSIDLGILFLLLLFTTLSLSKWTSLIVCYPFCFCFSFTLILCSVLLLLKYLEQGKRKFLLLSSIVYFLGLLFYEIYMIYLLIVAIIIIAHYIELKQTTSSTFQYNLAFKTLVPYAILGLIYISIYITFYLIYPSHYSGNSVVSEIKLETILLILKNYSDSAFPLSVFYENQYLLNYQSDLVTGFKNDFIYLFMNAKVEWLVKAILVCLLFIQLSVNLPKITIKKTFVGILAALILIYLSHILLTITKKYSIEVPDMRGYITTFFSFFGVALLLALLCNLFYTFASRNKIAKITYMSVVVIYLFTCSIQTSYSNYYTAQNMAQSKLAFDVVNTFLSWEKFNQISDNSILYAEDLWKTSTTQIDLFGQGFNWEAYIYNKKKKLLHTAANITTYNELAKQDTSAPIYFIGKQEAHKTKEAVLLFAPIDRSKTLNNKITPIVNNVTIFYYSAYKEFSVTFSMKNPLLKEKKLLIGSYLDSTKENHFSFNVNCLEKNNASSIIELSAPNIDLNSIVISNMLLSNSPTIEIR